MAEGGAGFGIDFLNAVIGHIGHEDAVAAVDAAAKAELAKGKNLELIVEALDSVDLEYLDGNGQAQKIRLNADQVHTFKSNAGLKLSVSNGGAVNLILNGKDLGVPGEVGKSIKLNY